MIRKTLLQYTKTVSTVASLSGSVNIVPPIQFNRARPHTIKVHYAQIPKNIPNIYEDAASGINNRLLEISNGTTTESIQLATGVYTVSQLDAAINDVISGWMTDITDSAFSLRANTALGLCYIILDSTKLSSGTQISVNFAPTGSTLYQMLGFTSPSSFTSDGTYTANAYPTIDAQGNSAKVYLNGLGPLALENSEPKNYLFSINLDTSSGANTYVYPGAGGAVPYEIDCRTSDFLANYEIKILGRNDKEIVAYDGTIILDFTIFEY